jgi:hypothetical protein
MENFAKKPEYRSLSFTNGRAWYIVHTASKGSREITTMHYKFKEMCLCRHNVV